ncbi:4-hydroxy-L-threonine phosphate dehydrogenase, NAD-dependent [Rhodospirillaceae bacterium LM-1]|nr:4-hydroxy-L-threonine phosphate dehydrogenase, NAD-dependent [Rhodospirillaceae bacterium LM-1]
MTALPLALSMGEPSGIGGEIALKAWMRRHEGLSPFFVLDDPKRLQSIANALGWRVPIQIVQTPKAALDCFDQALPVVPLSARVESKPGHPDVLNAKAVIESISRAVEMVVAGQAAALVTNPIHKAVLKAAGFAHPGHTEFLAELAGNAQPVMMLTANGLRVVPVTIHMPLKDVPGRLSQETILHQGRILSNALKCYFSLPEPRIAVTGINPHAGEDGVLGREEIDIIRPAIEALLQEGVNAFGPLPADTLFHAEARAGYDAVMCMYHDQALIPVKMLGFWEGVNVTLGLPFIRTSPDHGTALGLAGTGKADPGSLMAALKLAAQMANAHAAAA